MRENEQNHIKDIKHIKSKFLTKTSEESLEELKIASIYIKQLNNFIDEKIQLSENKVYLLLNYLYINHSLHLIYELNEGINLRRARKFEEINPNTKFCFNKTSELSVIPDDEKDKVCIGRLNKEKQPIYYACISENNFNNYDVALLEVDAREMECINYLDSLTTGYLNVIRIGSFDLFMRNQKLPHWIDRNSYKLFEFFKKECEKNQNEYLLQSHQICSAFFSDILSRKNQSNLYKVTSVLADIIFENPKVDAIVYESVQVNGAPLIAVKPKSLYKKIEHKTVSSIIVDSNLGYGISHVKLINEGKVEGKHLKWGI